MELSILVIDDSEDDLFLFKKLVSKSGIQIHIKSSMDGDTGIESMVTSHPDCVFLDYNLPGMDGLAVLKKIRSLGIDTPVIMLTGQKSENAIVELMKEGATDYLPKNSLTSESLRLSIENSQRLYKIKKEKLQAEKALKISEARLAEAQDIALIGNWEFNYLTQTFFLSEMARRILEMQTSLLSDFEKKIDPEDFRIIKRHIRNLDNNNEACEVNTRFISSDYSTKYLNIKCHIILNDLQEATKVVGTIQDITILKNALTATKKATVKSRATTIVLGIAVLLFLLSEAILDPFIDSMTASLLISLSFKGTIAVMLKPIEIFLEKIMLGKLVMG
jgi:DNA-binding response OmpR family regulator